MLQNIALRSLPSPEANIAGSISSGLLPVNQAANRCNAEEDSGTYTDILHNFTEVTTNVVNKRLRVTN